MTYDRIHLAGIFDSPIARQFEVFVLLGMDRAYQGWSRLLMEPCLCSSHFVPSCWETWWLPRCCTELVAPSLLVYWWPRVNECRISQAAILILRLFVDPKLNKEIYSGYGRASQEASTALVFVSIALEYPLRMRVCQMFLSKAPCYQCRQCRCLRWRWHKPNVSTLRVSCLLIEWGCRLALEVQRHAPEFACTNTPERFLSMFDGQGTKL